MCVLIGRHVCLDESMCTQLRHFRFARILEKYFTKALEQFVRVYIPSFKSLEERAGGGEWLREFVMPTFHYVMGLHNCLEFSESCLDEDI